MKGGLVTILVVMMVSLSTRSLAQCPTPDFTLPATACRDQNLSLTNLSSAGTFQWDYCTGDLSNTPAASAAYNLPGANGRPTFEYVQDGNKWYAFVTGTFSNRLYRIQFDNDPSLAPALVENLGDLGGKLKGPGTIRIVKSSGSWFGLVHNTDNGELLKLSFGNSLANDITTSSLLTGVGSTNNGMAVGHDGSNGWVCIISNANTFQIIRLGENLSSPGAGDVLITPTVPNPNNLFDVDIVQVCDQWFGFATNLGNGNFYQLSFGSSLFQQPAINEIGNLGGINTCRVRVIKDGEQYYLLIATLTGSFFKVALGSDLDNPTVVIDDEGSFSSVLQNSIAVGAVVNNSKWSISVVDGNTGNVSSVAYPNNCSAVAFDQNDVAPGVRYTQSGTYSATLTMTNAAGLSASVTKSVTVSGSQSPDISISTQNVCAGHNVTFTPNSVAGGVSTYDWNFGDATAHSNSISPVHVYSAAGTFKPTLNIVASNGCTNKTEKTIKLYDEPVADFTTPAGLVCTNNKYTIVNNTSGNYDGILQYSWMIDGSEVSTARDLEYTFTSTGNEDVELTVTIPGCSDNLTKTINNIDSGPTVGFTFTGQCENSAVAFTNNSSGSIAGYLWTFADGNTSTSTSPSHSFADPGVFSVSLATTGTNGCVSTTSKNVPIYTAPQPTLSLDLPPFSCAGTPSQFHDATGALPDSNIQTWAWTFGDGATGIGKNPVHTYTQAGPYTVRLAVTTDKGCSGFSDQGVTIAASPVAAFNLDAACANQATHFTDGSAGNVVAWQWKTGPSVYTTQNPTHVFAAPGNFSMQLTVTAQNNCTNTLTKFIVVPVVPVVDFSTTNLCSAQPTVFKDLTVNAADPVSQRSWTFNGGNAATGQEVQFSFENSGTFPVQLQVQSQSGCVYTTSKQVVIRPSPVASFTTSDQSGPPPLNVSFTNTSTGAVSYQWAFDDGSQLSTVTSPQHTFNNLGDYDVNLTATSVDGCKKSEIKIISVIVPKNELALEDLTLVMPSGTNAYFGYVRVRNNGNYRIEKFTVNYTVGGGVRLREVVTATLNVGETGTFILSNQFLDAGTSAFVCAEVDADEDLSDNKACATLGTSSVILNAGPNPADTYINIESVSPSPGVINVRLYSMGGGQAYDRTFDAAEGLTRLSIDVQNLVPGLYVLVVSNGSTSTSSRMLIYR